VGSFAEATGGGEPDTFVEEERHADMIVTTEDKTYVAGGDDGLAHVRPFAIGVGVVIVAFGPDDIMLNVDLGQRALIF
jgi:hypothetical protein